MCLVCGVERCEACLSEGGWDDDAVLVDTVDFTSLRICVGVGRGAWRGALKLGLQGERSNLQLL